MIEIVRICGNCLYYIACGNVDAYKERRGCADLSKWEPDYVTLKSMLQQRDEVIKELIEELEKTRTVIDNSLTVLFQKHDLDRGCPVNELEAAANDIRITLKSIKEEGK